jgi:Xaa-Pro aminopeptidase
VSERQAPLPNRAPPYSDAFKAFIADGWAPYPAELPGPLPATEPAAVRRSRVSALFPGERLIVPAGGYKVRSNDTDYRFRPHSAFAHLTGLGTDREPGALLVLEPGDDGHEATLFFTPRAARDTAEFYSDPRYGEMWVGRRPSLDEMGALCGLRCADVAYLDSELAKNASDTPLRVLREADPVMAGRVDAIRTEAGRDLDDDRARDAELATALSELRLVKDDFEVEQMRAACAETARAFEAVVVQLGEAVRRGRGERWVEGVFGLHARHAGNAVGYDTIAAGGDHANTLHWIRNDGDLVEGDLLLMDAGVELDTLYTADLTRTMPVSGRFTDAQRKVYDAVLEAQEAGIAAARPGAAFLDIHRAAVAVLARQLQEWGMLPVSAEESLTEAGGQHRRWMVHGTSHHLGLDVHDCAQARHEHYREGTLQPGMVITVEPGLYFKTDDLLVPAELRGIGVRIEDDIVITADGAENLSAMLPRGSAEVEAWMAYLIGSGDAGSVTE